MIPYPPHVAHQVVSACDLCMADAASGATSMASFLIFLGHFLGVVLEVSFPANPASLLHLPAVQSNSVQAAISAKIGK